MAESGDQEQSTVSAAELAANITSGGIDVTPDQDGGVLKEIKRAGSGFDGPCPGDTVRVHYVGTLLDGTQFDSSRDRGEKFEFKIGKGQVIKAWDMGVATMKRGELAVLTCKSQYAYGDHGSPPKIPGKATLVFEVELFDWKGMTSSLSVVLSCIGVHVHVPIFFSLLMPNLVIWLCLLFAIQIFVQHLLFSIFLSPILRSAHT